MRRRALERAEPGWERQAVESFPASYPDDRDYVLRSPLELRMMPCRLRFLAAQDGTGMRPVGRGLERAVGDWLLRACAGDTHGDVTIAGLMAAEVGPGETLLLALTSGAGVHHFTHYRGWRSDHAWAGDAEWEARLELVAASPDEYLLDLGQVADWMVVPDPDEEFRSVLVACPEADIVSGRWWQYAVGSRGAPMPTFDLGDHLFGDEMYWLLGGDEFRAPTIRELSLARRNYFAIDGGPAGYVQFADPNSVGFSSAFFDEASPQYLAHQRSVLEQEEWGGLEDSIPRVLQMLPRIRRFYERAWTSGYWVVHYGYVTEVEPPPTELRIEPLPRRGAVPAAWPVRRQGTR